MSVLFWMKCSQLPYQTVTLPFSRSTYNHEKTAKNHKRRNVTDHIVRYYSLVLRCFYNNTVQENSTGDSVLFWMKLN